MPPGIGVGLSPDFLAPSSKTDAGTGAARLGALVAAASGDFIISGTDASNLAALVPAASGDFQISGTAASRVGALVPAGSGSEFDPSQLSGLLLWVAADLGSPTSSLWTDQSGNGNNLTSTVGPTVGANAMGTGKPGLTGNGSSQWMQSINNIGFSSTKQATIYVACLGTLTALQIFLEVGPGGNVGDITFGGHLVASGDVGAIMYSGTSTFSEETATPSGFGSAGQWSCVYDATAAQASQQIMRWNRAAMSQTNHSNATPSANLANDKLNVFSRNKAQFFASITFGEIIVCSGAHPAGTISNVETYFKNKWNTP